MKCLQYLLKCYTNTMYSYSYHYFVNLTQIYFLYHSYAPYLICQSVNLILNDGICFQKSVLWFQTWGVGPRLGSEGVWGGHILYQRGNKETFVMSGWLTLYVHINTHVFSWFSYIYTWGQRFFLHPVPDWQVSAAFWRGNTVRELFLFQFEDSWDKARLEYRLFRQYKTNWI